MDDAYNNIRSENVRPDYIAVQAIGFCKLVFFPVALLSLVECMPLVLKIARLGFDLFPTGLFEVQGKPSQLSQTVVLN